MIAARTIESWLALFAARCFPFISLSALWRFGQFAPTKEYDPARTQSNRTVSIHEIGQRVLQNEGEFELV
jgi:hypothetical protein